MKMTLSVWASAANASTYPAVFGRRLNVGTTIATRGGFAPRSAPAMLVQQVRQVRAVLGLGERTNQPLELSHVDEALAKGDLLGTGNHQPLALFDGLHELAGREQRVRV